MTSGNLELIRRVYEEVYNRGVLDALEDIYTAEYFSHPNSINPEGVRGPEGIRETVRTLRDAVPDVRFEILDAVSSGDKVVTRWKMTGTMTGSMYGFPPTGIFGHVTGITIHRIHNGRVAEAWEEADMLGAFNNFGIMPKQDG
jgi:steroid delta-isomerase-like uncharacterized protein